MSDQKHDGSKYTRCPWCNGADLRVKFGGADGSRAKPDVASIIYCFPCGYGTAVNNAGQGVNVDMFSFESYVVERRQAKKQAEGAAF